jgi:hypothetical protein
MSDRDTQTDAKPSNLPINHCSSVDIVQEGANANKTVSEDAGVAVNNEAIDAYQDLKQKDTINGSRLQLPPPPPPLPQSDRFFKPVGVGAVDEGIEHNVTLGRRDVVTPPVGTAAPLTTIQSFNASAASSAVSQNTTPQLSPSTISSLRGISSPSNSQVSFGSSNPTLLNSVLSKKHYDLTPVTRNTSSDLYCDAKNNMNMGSGENLDSSVMTVTPSSQQDTDGYLHGEHLAFPSDLSRTTVASGPAMPPLQRVAIHRRNSKQQLVCDPSSLHHDEIVDNNDTTQYRHIDGTVPSGLFHTNIEVENQIDGPTAAVQFPSRKYYSFTTRDQYEEACRYDPDSDDDLFIPSDDDDSDSDGHLKRMAQSISPRMGLIPYAPDSRPANFDIEQVPEEELRRIFISRGSSSTSNVYDPNNNASSSFDYSAEHKSISNTSLLSSTVPFGPMRVPSLHMANQLRQDSTTSISYTDQEDEDSIIVRINENGDDGSYVNENDDASLSSFGSNLNLQAMVSNNEVCGIMEEQDDFIVAAKLQLRHQRKRKQRRKKEQEKAMEWLQSVEANPENDIAEAASSKFLTTTSVQAPYYYHHHTKHRSTPAVPLQRQMSVPVNAKSPSMLIDTPLITNTKSAKHPNFPNQKAPPN